MAAVDLSQRLIVVAPAKPAGAGEGPRAAGASGRDLWGLGAIAGCCAHRLGSPLTIIATLTRPVDHNCYTHARARPAAAGCGCAGDRGRRFLFAFGESRSRLEPGKDLGLPGRAAATYGVAARSPGCCAQRLGALTCFAALTRARSADRAAAAGDSFFALANSGILRRRWSSRMPLPCCGLGHRIGDGPVPRLSSTGAVTSAADLTRGRGQRSPRSGFGKRQKEIGDSGRRRSGGRCGAVGASRAWRRRSRLTRPRP